MIPGQLRWRIELHSDGTPTADSLGQMTPDDTLIGTYWGKITTATGREQTNALQQKSEATHVVTLRWLGESITIKPTMRLVYKTRAFSVLWVNNVDERNRQLDVYCLEVTSPP